jgi:hypothetical protein
MICSSDRKPGPHVTTYRIDRNLGTDDAGAASVVVVAS